MKDVQTKQRCVNLDLMTCTCMRKSYFGFPCSHIFSVLIKNEEKMTSIISNLVLDRWQVNQQDLSSSFIKQSTMLQFKIFRTPVKKVVSKNKKTKNEENKENLSNMEFNAENKNKNIISTIQEKNKNLKIVEMKTKSQSLKKPKNAYFLYQDEVKEDFIKKFPSLKWVSIVGKIAEAYRKLSKEKREEYEKKALGSKKEYEKNLNTSQISSTNKRFNTEFKNEKRVKMAIW